MHFHPFPVMWLNIQDQRYTLVVDTAASPVNPVLLLCPQTSLVALNTRPPGPGTPPSLCATLVGLNGAVAVVVVVARTHPHQ